MECAGTRMKYELGLFVVRYQSTRVDNLQAFLPVEQSETFATAEARKVITNITYGMIPYKKRYNSLVCILSDRD